MPSILSKPLRNTFKPPTKSFQRTCTIHTMTALVDREKFPNLNFVLFCENLYPRKITNHRATFLNTLSNTYPCCAQQVWHMRNKATDAAHIASCEVAILQVASSVQYYSFRKSERDFMHSAEKKSRNEHLPVALALKYYQWRNNKLRHGKFVCPRNLALNKISWRIWRPSSDFGTP